MIFTPVLLIWFAVMLIGLIAGLFMMASTSNHYETKENKDAALLRADDVEISGTATLGAVALVTTTGAQVLTNKTIALGSNVVSGTLAEFNTAITDDNILPLSQKGAVSGVATLDAAQKLTLAQLPVTAVTYDGAWDALLNQPILADGVGTRAYCTIDNTTAAITGAELVTDTGTFGLDIEILPGVY